MRQGYVQIPGAEVHYLEAGQGPPLVLVHGLAASWRWWTPVLDALTARHRVIAFDLPGFGQTRGSSWSSIGSAGRFIRDAMAALELERADLIGHSLGGRICVDVAANFPDRVGQLVLVSAVGLPWRKWYPVIGLDLLREGQVSPPKFPELVREDARRVRFFDLALATYQTISGDCRSLLKRVKAPTLVVWGGRDVLTPLRFGQELAERIDSARLVVLDTAGHTPMWDDPDGFASQTLRFLDAPALMPWYNRADGSSPQTAPRRHSAEATDDRRAPASGGTRPDHGRGLCAARAG